jgi:hypothetical protein
MFLDRMALRVTPLPGTLEAPAVHLVIQDKNEPGSRIVEMLINGVSLFLAPCRIGSLCGFLRNGYLDLLAAICRRKPW